MKIKRLKKVNKSLNFYSVSFGFRQPYQILVDGTFCYAALNNKINIANDIPKYLQGEVKLLTTQCIIIEMENLSKSLGGALLILKKYGIHKCGHEGKPKPGSKCMLSMLGKKNENHYIIATQDRDLQSKVREIPGAPLLYLHIKTPVLEHPSDVSVKYAKDKMTGLSEFEKRKLEELKSVNQEDGNKNSKRKKKKKGQNPLSCLKKKKQKNNTIVKKDGVQTEVEKKRRKKVRIPQHVREELLKNKTNNS